MWGFKYIQHCSGYRMAVYVCGFHRGLEKRRQELWNSFVWKWDVLKSYVQLRNFVRQILNGELIRNVEYIFGFLFAVEHILEGGSHKLPANNQG